MESFFRLFAPSRAEDNAAEVGPFEVGIEEREHVVIDSAEGCFRFVAKAVMEGVNDLLLKVIATGMCVDDCFALDIGHVEVAHPQDIHFNPRRDEGDFRLLVLGNARRGMQRDGVPHYVDSSFVAPCWLRNSRAALALSTSNRSVALRNSFVRPMSWNMAPT